LAPLKAHSILLPRYLRGWSSESVIRAMDNRGRPRGRPAAKAVPPRPIAHRSIPNVRPSAHTESRRAFPEHLLSPRPFMRLVPIDPGRNPHLSNLRSRRSSSSPSFPIAPDSQLHDRSRCSVDHCSRRRKEFPLDRGSNFVR